MTCNGNRLSACGVVVSRTSRDFAAAGALSIALPFCRNAVHSDAIIFLCLSWWWLLFNYACSFLFYDFLMLIDRKDLDIIMLNHHTWCLWSGFSQLQTHFLQMLLIEWALVLLSQIAKGRYFFWSCLALFYLCQEKLRSYALNCLFPIYATFGSPLGKTHVIVYCTLFLEDWEWVSIHKWPLQMSFYT